MKAIRFDRLGPPEMLQLADTDEVRTTTCAP